MLSDGYYALGEDSNKVRDTDSAEGISSPLLPELDLQMDDSELVALQRDWLKAWEPYAGEIDKVQKENEHYWLGKQFATPGEGRPLVDNLIFESLETFLPIATRPKAEPLVEGDNTEVGNEVADKVRKMLGFIADNLSYNLKVKQVARYWALYMLGAMKVGWSMKENDITCAAIRPQKLILDPTATIEECEYNGYYIGERLQDMASDLALRFPKFKSQISDKVNGKMGTKVDYILWTTNEYMFWTMGDIVLNKIKNPHWNYETTIPESESVDEYGNPTIVPATKEPGKNHFNTPKMPYIFLSVFNIGKRPHDDTNLIQQNLPLQDLINKRLAQIDLNADNANNGLIVSGDAFTEEQAMQMGKTLRKRGGVVWVPSGDVNASVKRDTASALPNFVYESLIDYRNEVRNIFGTRGSTAQGTMNEQTVGGKNIIKNQDTDRIGGGVSTYLEQFSDHVFNWFVQLMYVYYDEPHFATVLGKERAREYIELSNQDLGVKLLVGVKEGSMIPTDPVSQRNEAVELWTQSALDPITFFEKLDFPNPREAAKRLYQWQADPIALFPDLQEEQMAQQQAQMEQQAAQSQEQQAAQLAQQQEQEALNHEREVHKMGLQALVK